MSQRIISRLFQGLITMWAVMTVVFFLMRISGDPIDLIFAGDPRPEAIEEAEAMRTELGLDRHVAVQYVDYLTDVLLLDFGNSITQSRPVTTMMREKMPETLRLTLTAFILSYAIAIPLGVFIALRKNTLVDYGIQVLTMIGVSLPSFWLGILIILLFAVRLDLFPALSNGGQGLEYLILPAMTIAIPRISFMARFVRGAMLDVLNQDYLRTAYSKGLRDRQVIYRHGLRNALIPIITVAGIQLGYLVSGSVIIERVFGIQGIGDMLVDSISGRDFPVTQATVLVIALSIVVMNLLVDIMYVYIDPRLRTE